MVACQRCQQNLASRTVYDSKGQQIFLCESCAQQNEGTFVHKMLLPVLMGSVQLAATACPSCGTTLQHLHQSSLLGCSDCYRHFRDPLLSTILRMQGAVQHKPRPIPEPTGELPAPPAGALTGTQAPPSIEEMQRQLETAVGQERYEEAARLRDLIRARQQTL